MDVEQRIKLIKEVGEEVLTEEDLRELLMKKKNPLAYDGFEPSNRIHIAQGILRTINVNKMLKAGCKFIMWVADWHAWANNKLGGDLEKIQTTGKYFIEVWKACGMSTDKVKFEWCSKHIKDENYWKTVLQVARNTTLQRTLRCTQIMGRKETDVLSSAQIMYPMMQCADIFHLNIDICQLGLDQRKVNVLAREVGEKIGYWKPVAVHHHMLMGLKRPEVSEKESIERSIMLKMSKSIPDSAVFIDDPAEEVERKIKNAWCPEKQVHENPIIEYFKYIIFEKFTEVIIKRPAKFGGDLRLKSYEELTDKYSNGKIHPLDLKGTCAEYVNKMLEPVRKHFAKGKARELMETVKGYSVTR